MVSKWVTFKSRKELQMGHILVSDGFYLSCRLHMDGYSWVTHESRLDYRYVIDGSQICHKWVLDRSQMDHRCVADASHMSRFGLQIGLI